MTIFPHVPTSSGRTYLLYDGPVAIIEVDSSGSATATNSFGIAGLVSRRASSSVFYSFDSEGNVARRTDSNANVLSDHLFDAYGVSMYASLTEPFGYKAQFGYYTDNETGLQLLTHRYYDPSTGRFVTRDPIGYPGGINLYSYVQNGPVNAIDPLGLHLLPDWMGYNRDSENGIWWNDFWNAYNARRNQTCFENGGFDNGSGVCIPLPMMGCGLAIVPVGTSFPDQRPDPPSRFLDPLLLQVSRQDPNGLGGVKIRSLEAERERGIIRPRDKLCILI